MSHLYRNRGLLPIGGSHVSFCAVILPRRMIGAFLALGDTSEDVAQHRSPEPDYAKSPLAPASNRGQEDFQSLAIAPQTITTYTKRQCNFAR